MRIIGLSLLLILATACAGTGTSTPTQPTVTARAVASGSASATASTPASATSAAPLLCAAPAQALVELTEGPYYKAGAPQRSTLATSSTAGTALVLSGYVVTRSCQPIANAKLDFWQADGNGSYDNSGYNLRGWQLTSANGAYRLETVIPGLYPGRTEHIHVKVTPPNGQTYTSQLFFPGVSQNEADSIYSSSMLVTLDSTKTPAAATFTFVVNLP